MPTSIEHLRQAARKHGAYAIEERGEAAMDRPQRSRYVELQEQLQDREGVVAALVDQAAKLLVMVEAAQSYVAGQAKAGYPLGDIPLLRSLPAFWNSANRALLAVLANLPSDEDQRMDITTLLRGSRDEDD